MLRRHIARLVKNYLKNSDWKFLPHPPHCPDFAPFDYTYFNQCKRKLYFYGGLDSLLASKDKEFFRRGTRKIGKSNNE